MAVLTAGSVVARPQIMRDSKSVLGYYPKPVQSSRCSRVCDRAHFQTQASVSKPYQSQRHTHGRRYAVAASAPSPSSTQPVCEPVCEEASAFSPATVANLGSGFDFMGCAVEGQGDIVTVKLLRDKPGQVIIEKISGDEGRLSMVAKENCAGIAAWETLKLLGVEKDYGLSIVLDKGLPLGSGLGSSAASAGAAAWAVNELFGCPLSKEELVPAGLVSEAFVSGYHADNIAPAIMGGFILVRCYEPSLKLQKLEFGGDEVWFVVVTPVYNCPTREMRAALPKMIDFKQHTHNCSAGASLVSGILLGDLELLGQGMHTDCIVEPARAPLIPGFKAVKAAAMEAGSLGCTISGAGPTVVALARDKASGIKVCEAMVEAFKTHGKLEVNRAAVTCLCKEGAQKVDPKMGFKVDPERVHFVV
mmetsp:Transcript_26650/g.44650  ORF Transcript_26650/g.44650 Transcript_26650/m.44650 type:complete len:418 (+) Transcript_26650:430-1683(+)